MTVEVFAPAKINLTLHVTGQRSDGYHLLDSLVIFADVGDRITLTKAAETRLAVSGPSAAGVPVDGRNLVVKAAQLMGVTAGIHLHKALPAAAGIGGGSSDAAATLIGLSQLFDMPLPGPDAVLSLGADVPLCLRRGLVRMQGIGEQLTVLGSAPEMHLVMVNPRVEVPTPTVFKALGCKDNPAMDWPMTPIDWVSWVAEQRNDLEAPAVAAEPVIADVLEVLRAQTGCRLARMSGSGATCFAIMDGVQAQKNAVAHIKTAHPDWWAVACQTLSGDQFRRETT
jgi:4-diphosphocytidyl-2-C-methyl-D-erythritol kinase